MKVLASIDQDLGAEGAKVGGAIGIEGKFLKVEAHALYPIGDLVEKVSGPIDALLAKLEAAIPGDWDKPMIEGFKAQYKEDLVKVLAE